MIIHHWNYQISKPANDAKKQFCKECPETNLRYDAKLLGYPIAFRQELQLKD